MSEPDADQSDGVARDGVVPDTVDLRSGAVVDDSLLALLPLIGTWRGGGAALDPVTGEPAEFAQQLTIGHDGRAFLTHDSRRWVRGADTGSAPPMWREAGFWRAGPGVDDVELVLAAADGRTLHLAGLAGDQRWDLATVTGGERGERLFLAVVGEELLYATEVALPGRAFVPERNGRLRRRRPNDQ